MRPLTLILSATFISILSSAATCWAVITALRPGDAVSSTLPDRRDATPVQAAAGASAPAAPAGPVATSPVARQGHADRSDLGYWAQRPYAEDDAPAGSSADAEATPAETTAPPAEAAAPPAEVAVPPVEAEAAPTSRVAADEPIATPDPGEADVAPAAPIADSEDAGSEAMTPVQREVHEVVLREYFVVSEPEVRIVRSYRSERRIADVDMFVVCFVARKTGIALSEICAAFTGDCRRDFQMLIRRYRLDPGSFFVRCPTSVTLPIAYHRPFQHFWSHGSTGLSLSNAEFRALVVLMIAVDYQGCTPQRFFGRLPEFASPAQVVYAQPQACGLGRSSVIGTPIQPVSRPWSMDQAQRQQWHEAAADGRPAPGQRVPHDPPVSGMIAGNTAPHGPPGGRTDTARPTEPVRRPVAQRPAVPAPGPKPARQPPTPVEAPTSIVAVSRQDPQPTRPVPTAEPDRKVPRRAPNGQTPPPAAVIERTRREEAAPPTQVATARVAERPAKADAQRTATTGSPAVPAPPKGRSLLARRERSVELPVAPVTEADGLETPPTALRP